MFTDSLNAPGKIMYSLVSTANSGTYVADPVSASPVIMDGAWHNVVGIVDRTNALASVCVDGAFAGSWTIDGLGTLITAGGLTIAQDPTGTYGTAGSFDLDDMGIWRQALDPILARSIYYAGKAGHSFDTVAPLSVTLSIALEGGSLQLQWSQGALQASGQADTGYTNVLGAAPPSYSIPLPKVGSAFYRVKVQ